MTSFIVNDLWYIICMTYRLYWVLIPLNSLWCLFYLKIPILLLNYYFIITKLPFHYRIIVQCLCECFQLFLIFYCYSMFCSKYVYLICLRGIKISWPAWKLKSVLITTLLLYYYCTFTNTTLSYNSDVKSSGDCPVPGTVLCTYIGTSQEINAYSELHQKADSG